MVENHHFKGTVLYGEHVVSVIDIQHFINEQNDLPYQEIVILKFGKDSYIGILVHSLSDIPEIDISDIKSLQEYIIGNGTLVQSVVFPNKSNSNDVLSILSVEKINDNLVEPNLTHMTPKRMSA